jgi:hypothetical protein
VIDLLENFIVMSGVLAGVCGSWGGRGGEENWTGLRGLWDWSARLGGDWVTGEVRDSRRALLLVC